jgi:CPA2 family monovalent cation:H+ antiporter-2
MHSTLQLVLILLAASVLVVGAFRFLRLPPMLGYLLIGIVIGPHALAWLPASNETSHLAEFGVVFLMFSIGLEFSLPRLVAMRRTVFGLGGLQVAVSLIFVLAVALVSGLGWVAGIALGGAVAMSSTAIVSKMLAERLELQSPHGRQIIGVLLFQDLAVVPLLILVPALAGNSGDFVFSVSIALAKAVLALLLLLSFGQRLMRPWFHWIAGQKSSELFMLNVLLITLGLAYLTELAGLSLALGAFLAGMLISETEYRYQVEDDIKPFRDVLLGLFFVTIGMLLDLGVIAGDLVWVALLLIAILVVKTLIVWALGRALGNEGSVAFRTGIHLAQGGEFGFVLLAQANGLSLFDANTVQVLLSAMLLSMLAAPFMIKYADVMTQRLFGGEWSNRAKELHEIMVRSLVVDGHVILCGYGRSGQNLARLLEAEDINFIALDIDPQRVKAAAAAGESVVYGDSVRREVLMAAGLSRAKAMVVTFSDVPSAMKILRHVQELRPELPVIVRTLDDTDLDKLRQAGAVEVVPEELEGSLMLASHAMLLLGLPLSRVLKRIREVREHRYGFLSGFFHGATDIEPEQNESSQPRLHSVFLSTGAAAVGKTLADMLLDKMLVEVIAVRRRNIRGLAPQSDTRLEEGDVLVLRGVPEGLAAAEIKLLQG